MHELFAYYRVRSDDATALQAAVFMFQAQLIEGYPGLRARLLRRPDQTGGDQTWMEHYATDPQRLPFGVSEAMQAEIALRAVALANWVQGDRHTEVFVNCTGPESLRS